MLSRYDARAVLPLHEHVDAYVCVNLSSDFLESSRHAATVVPRFAAVAHPAGEAHQNQFDANGGLCVSIFCAKPTALAWNTATRNRAVSTQEKARELGAAFACQMQRYERFDQCAALSFTELALQLVQMLSNDVKDRRLNFEGIWRALDAMSQDPAHLWTTDELAAIAQLHPTHLARQVRKITGQTFGEHLRRRRTLKALGMLTTRADGAADVAHSCGFADQSHLTRTLSRLTGVTPGVLRNSR